MNDDDERREDLHALERGLVQVSGRAEDLLDGLRSGTLTPTAETTRSLAALLDALRDALGRIAATGGPGDETHESSAAEVDEPGLLLATGAGGAKLAVPLSAVQRLEQIARDQLQASEDVDVIRYGGSIVPVLWLAERDPQTPHAGLAQMIVCRSSAGLLGLVVDSIDDVVAQPDAAAQPTRLLDLEALAAAAHGTRRH